MKTLKLLVAFTFAACWQAVGMWLLLYPVAEVGLMTIGVTLAVGFAVASPVVALVGEAHFGARGVA